jgi:hypothetical protein
MSLITEARVQVDLLLRLDILSGNEILLHEIGHSLGDLGDEYYAGDYYARERPNMTQVTDPELVKWKNWLGYNGVGIYQHCCGGNSHLWHRPHNACKMRYLGTSYSYCPVCRETFVFKIIELFGTPVVDFYPQKDTVGFCDDFMFFTIDLVKPIPNTIKTEWFLNDSLIARNIDSVEIFEEDLFIGYNKLRVEVLDTTHFVRADNHAEKNTFNQSWEINYITYRHLIYYGQPIFFCEGDSFDSLSLISILADSYYWSHGDTTQFTFVNEFGTYFLTITDKYGCQYTDSISIIAHEHTDTVFYKTACDFYTWNNVLYSESGIFTDTLVNYIGCDSIMFLDLTIIKLDTTVTITDTSLISNAIGAKYQWLDCDNDFAEIERATYQIFTPHKTGNYAVKLKENECIGISDCFFINLDLSLIDFEREISVFPNPTFGIVVVETNFYNAYYEIVDVFGRVVLLGYLEDAKTEISFGELKAGVYFLRIYDATSKIIKF